MSLLCHLRDRICLLFILFGTGPLPAAPVPTAPPSPGLVLPQKASDAILVLKGHPKGIFHVAISADGKYYATSSKDQTARIWTAADGKECHVLKGHGDDVYSAAFSPDGRLLATACADHKVRLWNVQTGKEVPTLEAHTSDVYHVLFSPDGKTLASAGSDSCVILWDVAQGKKLHHLTGHSDRVLSVAFSPDGARLASACGTRERGGNSGGEVLIWDVASGKEIQAMAPGLPGTIFVSFSPDGKRLAGACINQMVRVWELATGRLCLELKGHTLEVYSVAFSPDGRFLASSSGKWNTGKGGEVKLWDLVTGEAVRTVTGFNRPIWALAFSPAGGVGAKSSTLPTPMRLAAATGTWDKNEGGEVRVFALAALPPLPVLRHGEARLAGLWADLESKDAVKAYRAVWALRCSSRQFLEFLAEHARNPGSPDEVKRLPQLIKALDDDDYERREQASRELEQLGQSAHPVLRESLPALSPEARRRAEEILEQRLSSEEVRLLRALEVVSTNLSPEARPLLKKLAGCGTGFISREAESLLRRIP